VSDTTLAVTAVAPSRATLRVDVTDIRANKLPESAVEVFRRTGEQVGSAKFDRATRCFVAVGIPVGELTVTVSHTGMERQTREVTLGQGVNEALFILAKPGTPTYFREKVRVPVDADSDLIGVTLDRKARRNGDVVDALAEELKLRPEKVSELAHRAGMRLLRVPKGAAKDALEALGRHPEVEHAGAVVSLRENGFSHLTRDVVVQVRRSGTNAARDIAKQYGYELMRELSYAPRTFVFRAPQAASLDLLESIERIVERDDVEWAEPSLVVAPEVDSVTPTDVLWPGLWDRQLIGLGDAWQSLQDAGLDTFGDPDILLAVWDSGVQQAAGVPTNGDFQGNVTNGQPKVFTSFDFETMVANNNSPWNDHGSGVAGVATAVANNVASNGEGFGVTGSAPNVQMMCLVGRTPYIDIEVSDQYIWMAGFNPNSPIAGFPAPPARGADVITCSLTPGAGAPLSGTARATLDFVTTFGRQGKGTICLFSTGNANQNNVTARPYGAYEKCLGIAGTSIGDDGVTEIRFPMSGWGQIALASPTQDTSPTVHNPPSGFMPWGAAHAGLGNLISFRQVTTTTTAASAVGATTLTLASVAGLAVNQVIHVGAIGGLGSEPARITAVNAGLNQITVNGHNGNAFTGGLLNAHTSGTAVAMGPANHRNNFGGTSSATPLCAGLAALVLSANPALTYIEAREILRNTAVKFDLANTDPVGQWLDANGNPSVTSGLPAVKSGWYGYGRIDAAAAVAMAVNFATNRDLVIRENLSDTGAVASSGAFWNSPDIWCRRTDPSTDPGALPASYAVAGPHEDPKRGQDNWVYLRVRNNGAAASLDAWVRISVTHFPGFEFTWPESFQPTNGPGDPLPSPMTPGTYFIGEAKVTGLAPGANQIVSVLWPAGLIPPESVVVGGVNVNWHPCLLAEITPHDGPAANGNHVWNDNNLAQKNISIVNADSGGDFAVALVVGNELNESKHLVLDVFRGRLPSQVQLFLDLIDPRLKRRVRVYVEENPSVGPSGPRRGIPDGNVHSTAADGGLLTALNPGVTASLIRRPEMQWKLGFHGGREVVFLKPVSKQTIPVFSAPGQLQPVVVGGIVGHGAKAGEYEVVVVQRNQSGEVSGSATLMVRIGNK